MSEEIVLIDHTIQVPKETKEVIDLIAAAIEQFKDGVQASDVTELIDELSAAFGGIGDLDDEFKSEHKEAIFAYLVHTVGAKLL